MSLEGEASTLPEQKEKDRTIGPLSLPLLRQCTFVLNKLYSCEDSYPFISPVPAVAIYYYERVEHPMDLSTLEGNLHRYKYNSFADFERDLELIWENAKKFHRPSDPLYHQAIRLRSCYMELPEHIRTNPIASSSLLSIPEEAGPASNVIEDSSQLYFTQVVGETEVNPKALRGFSKTRAMYNQLNAPFFSASSQFSATKEAQVPWPRLYISQNRTLMTEACESNTNVIAVLCNVQIKQCTDRLLRSHRLHHFKGDVILAEPMGTCHDVEVANLDRTDGYEYHAKGWIKLRIIKVVHGVETLVTSTMEKNFFRRAFATHRVSTVRKSDLKKANDMSGHIIALFIKSILSTTSNTDLPNAMLEAPIEAPVDIKPTSTPPYVPFKKRVAMMSKERQPSGVEDQSYKSRKRDFQDSPVNRRYTDDESDQSQVVSPFNGNISPKKESPPAQDLSYMTFRRYLDPDETTEQNASPAEESASRDYYIEKARKLWGKIFKMCEEKGVGVENVNKYKARTSAFPNAEGYFKHVYYLKDDSSIVVQTFRRMTISQRTTELASLLFLFGRPHMGQIVEVLQEDKGEIVGLAMERYQTTLKHYTHAHSHHRLTSYQKMDLVEQMLKCMDTIHSLGLAHRDLSELNFMVNETEDEFFEDGSKRATLYLIDFGKATFTKPEDVRYWWTERPRVDGEYDGEIVPETEEELQTWLTHLPLVKAKPDHGYRHYRSIQTLPQSRVDTDILPWRINPIAEDMYSIGTIIWKVFAETEPWHGILDTDLKGLRETVQNDESIQTRLEREVAGQLSRELLLFCLRADSDNRKSAAEILTWLAQTENRNGLMDEWRAYAPENRRKRHAKASFEFEDEQARGFKQGKRGRPRGRPPLQPASPVQTERRPRGRPRGSSSAGSRYIPTGRPRGRPRGSGRRIGRLEEGRSRDPDAQPSRTLSVSIHDRPLPVIHIQPLPPQDASTQTPASNLFYQETGRIIGKRPSSLPPLSPPTTKANTFPGQAD